MEGCKNMIKTAPMPATISGLAQLAGVTRVTMSRYLDHPAHMPFYVAVMVADKTGLDLDTIATAAAKEARAWTGNL